jgi:hypothetical protein
MTLQVICTVVDDVGLVPTAGTIETTETFETCHGSLRHGIRR